MHPTCLLRESGANPRLIAGFSPQGRRQTEAAAVAKQVEHASPAEVMLTLHAGGTLHGTVRHRDGSPVQHREARAFGPYRQLEEARKAFKDREPKVSELLEP